MKSVLFLAPLAQAGTVVWNGFFNESYTLDTLDQCMPIECS
jgi:hypothetical protein